MSQQKRILFLVNGGGVGGAEQVFLRQAKYLKEEGFKVWRGAINDQQRRDPNLFNFGFTNLFDLTAYRRLLNFCKAQRLDYIYATLDQAIFISRLIKFFCPKLRVIIRESGIAQRKSFKIKLADCLFNILVDKIIAVSKEVSQSLLAYQPLAKDKIVVLNNGVDILLGLEDLQHLHKSSASMPIIILHVGSMHNNNKGQAGLLAAFKNVIDQSPRLDLHLYLVGQGKKRLELEKLAKALNLNTRVKFWGELDRWQLNKLYQQAHIFVLNSQNEGCPNVVLEAMSFGLAIVTSQVGGIAEMIKNQVSGLVFSVGDQLGLEHALLVLINNSQLRSSLGESAYQFVKNNLTWDQQNAKLKLLFTK